MNKKNWILAAIFIIWLVLVIFVGYHHEPWFDEAQAWLISRENSYIGILDAIRLEGHPLNWYYVLHTLQLCGLQYEHIFFVSIFFSAIGVYLFLFKTDFPIFIKAIFPFSYPIFYQYTIVSRSYCLIFPILMLYAICYRKHKYTNPYLIVLILILLTGISAYTMAFSAGLLILYLFDLLKNKKFSIKVVQAVPFLLYYYLFTYCYMLKGERNIAEYFYGFFDNIAKAQDIITYSIFSELLPFKIATILFYLLIFPLLFTFYKSKIKITVLFVGIFLYSIFFSFLAVSPWHKEMIFLFFIFFLCLDFEEKHKLISKNIIFYISLFLILAVSGYYTTKISLYEIKERYDSSKDVAQYIKEEKLENKKIYAYDYRTFSIQPYFKKPIFSNYSDKAYWYWYDFLSKAIMRKNVWFDEYTLNEILSLDSDVVIFSTNIANPHKLYNFLEKKKISYKKKEFISYRHYKDRFLENSGFVLLIIDKDTNETKT